MNAVFGEGDMGLVPVRIVQSNDKQVLISFPMFSGSSVHDLEFFNGRVPAANVWPFDDTRKPEAEPEKPKSWIVKVDVLDKNLRGQFGERPSHEVNSPDDVQVTEKGNLVISLPLGAPSGKWKPVQAEVCYPAGQWTRVTLHEKFEKVEES